MAITSYGTNDAMAVKLWSKRLGAEVLKTTTFAKYMGPGSDSMIMVKDETQKSRGDKITYGLRMQLTSDGVAGDGVLDGLEDALTTYNDNLVIDQLRNAVLSGGRMSQQRVPFEIRDEALSGLRDWFADRFDSAASNQLCGYTVQTDTRYTGMQATVAPDTNHIVRPASNEASDASISTTSLYTLSMIDKGMERAKTITPGIRPVKAGGKSFYVNVIHPYQGTDMRVTTTTGGWLDIQKSAMTGGEIDDNPIFDGSLGVYHNTLIHEDNRITYGVNGAAAVTGVRRALFCGAQAATIAFGRDNGPERFTWVEVLKDYENQLGVSAGTIFGLKKCVFNSVDYAAIVLASYAVAH